MLFRSIETTDGPYRQNYVAFVLMDCHVMEMRVYGNILVLLHIICNLNKTGMPGIKKDENIRMLTKVLSMFLAELMMQKPRNSNNQTKLQM